MTIVNAKTDLQNVFTVLMRSRSIDTLDIVYDKIS